ncbi:MAG: hypothetical protein ACM3SY_18850 [Candidatus Omnitrophota bacterium]
MWMYTTGTTYSGNFVGNAMVGMMMVSSYLNSGCFYCTKQTLTSLRLEDQAFDEAGKKEK